MNYHTTSTELVAYLQTKGYKVISQDYTSQKTTFTLDCPEDDVNLLKQLELFKTGKARVEPSKILNAYKELTRAIFINSIKNMKRWHYIYKELKSLLNPMGYWQNKQRGDPKLGYKKGFGKHRENNK